MSRRPRSHPTAASPDSAAVVVGTDAEHAQPPEQSDTVAHLSALVEQLQAQLVALQSRVFPDVPPVSPSSDAAEPRQWHAPKRTAPRLPTFMKSAEKSDVKDAHDFVQQFEDALDAESFYASNGVDTDRRNWPRLLLACTASYVTTWLRAERLLDRPWEEVRARFLERYGDPNRKLNLDNLLRNCRQQQGESLSDFANRFLMLMAKSDHDPEDDTLTSTFITNMLPEYVGQFSTIMLQEQNKTVATVVRYIKGLDANRESHRMQSRRPALTPSAAAPKPAPPSKPAQWCKWHRSSGHNTADCRNPGPQAPKAEPVQSAARQVHPGVCFACGHPGHMASNCPSKAATKQTGAKPHAFVIMAEHASELLTFPATLGDLAQPVSCVLDTGANRSVISASLASRLQVRFSASSDSCSASTVALADGSQAEILGETEALQLRVADRSPVQHRFLVLALPPPIELLVGLDLMSHVGITVHGLPAFGRLDDDNKKADSGPSFELSYVPSASLPTPAALSLEERETFEQAITQALARNEQLDPAEHCSHPFAEVELWLDTDQPLVRRQYRVEAARMQAVTAKVDEWLQKGYTTYAPAGCKYNSPLLAVPKRDAEGRLTKTRVCLDVRLINEHLVVDDAHEIPLIREILDKVANFKVVSKIDLAEGYHQLPIRPEHQPRLAFTWLGVQYMFRRAPFGVRHLPMQFQRMMADVVKGLDGVFVYLDDVVIVSPSAEEHAKAVVTVLDRLTSFGLRIGREKCEFGKSSLVLLGHRITQAGVEVDASKMEDLRRYEPPTTGQQIEAFLGFVNYFREHIPLYARIAAPLEPLRKFKEVKLTGATLEAFQSLKNMVLRAPVLSFPNFAYRFFVATDASTCGVGCVLFQDVAGERRIIAFHARALSVAERKYSATKLELLAIVFALRRCRFYLWGNSFTLLTDHRALSFMFRQRNTNRMLETWWEDIMDFSFEVIHVPGISNVLPDALSRLFPPQVRASLDKSSEFPMPLVMLSLRSGSLADLQVVPEEERAALLSAVHALGHYGVASMVKHLHFTRGVTWPSLRKDVHELVSSCLPCMQYTIRRVGYHPVQHIDALAPLEHVAVDLAQFPTSPRGFNFLLVVVDVATKFVWLRPLRNKEDTTLARVFFELCCDFGFPRVLQSDNGTEFVNRLVNALWSLAGVDARTITPYHPRANGAAERTVQTCKTALIKQLEGKWADWDLFVPITQLAQNVRIAKRTKSTPFAVMFARPFTLPSETDAERPLPDENDSALEQRLHEMHTIVLPALRRGKEDHFAREDAKQELKLVEFQVGDSVMVVDELRHSKMEPRYEGPFSVVKKTRGGSYTLLDRDGQLLARNYAPSQLRLVSRKKVVPDADSYVVTFVRDHRKTRSGIEYLVRWKGFSAQDDTWEPYSHFNHTKSISDYWERRKRDPNNGLAFDSADARSTHKTRRSTAPATRRNRVSAQDHHSSIGRQRPGRE